MTGKHESNPPQALRHRLKFGGMLLVCFLLSTLQSNTVASENRILLTGYVMDSQNNALELAHVFETQQLIGVTTDADGFYSLSIPHTDTLTVRFSCLGYQTAFRIIPAEINNLRVNVQLGVESKELNEVVVTGQQRQTQSFEKLDASRIRMMADPSGGSIEALLVTFAGVSSNNETSTQYSVRGGNYDENLVYVNGTEVYRPLLIRAGQQEGLSFVNPEMVREVSFSAGGFDVRYGDKMSSVLDIAYKKPSNFEAAVSASLMGSNVYAGHASSDGRFTQLHGFRYKSNQYLLGTLDTKGDYRPSFVDYQTYLTYQWNERTELSFLGNFSRNQYDFTPTTKQTDFGTFQIKRNFTVYFDGKEQDLFQTAFGSVKLNSKPNNRLNLSLQSSVFKTIEDENYDITGQYWLSETPIRNNQEDTENTSIIGTGTYHEHARNHLEASVINLSHQGSYILDRHNLKWGLGMQIEQIQDDLVEWEMRDSAGYTLPYNPTEIQTVYNLRSNLRMNSQRYTAYLLDVWRFRRTSGLYIIHAGLRSNYWTFNREWLISPRVSMTFIPSWERNITFRLGGGVYYQAPFYKELRDTAVANGQTSVQLNRHIRAPKSIQVLGGMDQHFIWLDRPFKFTIEGYYKDLSRLIPYTVDNVRIRYSGKNEAEGYTTGLDLKLFGEFVPGTDSWISLSLMRSQESIDGVQIPRPNEQRYNASIYFQDYFPGNPRFSMNLKLVLADGLPFGPPNADRSQATLRLPAYQRVDIGLSRVFHASEDAFMKQGLFASFKHIWVGVDCFNLLGIRNVNSYFWVTDIQNTQWAIPNYLTGRLINFRIAADF